MEIFTWLNLLSNYHILILHRRKGNEFMSQDTSTIKQLKARQNALLHGILLMSVLLLADTYLRTRSYILIDGIWDNTFIIVAAFTLILLEMIIKGAFDLSDPVWTVLAGAVGIRSIAAFVSQISLFFQQRQFLSHHRINIQQWIFLICSVLGMLVAAAYFIKRKCFEIKCRCIKDGIISNIMLDMIPSFILTNFPSYNSFLFSEFVDEFDQFIDLLITIVFCQCFRYASLHVCS